MHLSKHKNGFYYVYYIKPDGKRTSVSTRSRLKRDALEFLSNLKEQISEREKNKVIPILLKDFRFNYLRYSETVHSENTTKVFKVTFNFLVKYFGNVHLTEINPQKLDGYFQKRIIDSSVYPARKDLINLSSAFNWAVKRKYLTENPCKGFKRFKIPEKQPLFFSEIDFEVLLNVINEPDINDLVQFAVNTGLRQMELLTLQWNQINFKAKTLILDNRNFLTKSKKIRSIPLNINALQILTERERSKAGKLIFTLKDEPINRNFLVKQFKKYVKAANLNPSLSFHSLRHTFASWLVERGASIYSVSKLLGHSNLRVTEIYSHLRSEDLMNSVSKLDN